MSAPQAAQWFLLDVPGAPDAGRNLQQCFAEAPCHGLFENTDLHDLRDQGPQLVEL
ncbi:hypothetical protein D3C84_137190 [compost metagenome]